MTPILSTLIALSALVGVCLTTDYKITRHRRPSRARDMELNVLAAIFVFCGILAAVIALSDVLQP